MTNKQSQSGIKIEDPKLEHVSLKTAAIDQKTKDFKELLEEEMAETIDQMKKEFSDRDQNNLDERSRKRLQILRDKVSNLQAMNQRALDEYSKSVKAGKTDLAELSKRLRADIAEQTKTKLRNLKAVIDVKAGEEITTDEVRALEQAAKALEDFEKNHKELQPVFDKLAQKRDLSKQEYRLIAALVQPHNVGEGGEKYISFEQSAGGLLISMMKPAQKYEFVEEFMDTNQSKQSADLIDTFLKMGILSRMQGEKLFEQAVEKGVISQERFEKDFKKKLESGFYEAEVAKVKSLIQEEVKKNFAGRYSENFLNRFVGAPLVGVLMTAWGSATAVFNLLASRGEGFTSTIEKFLSSGYGPLGVAVAATGTEMFTGSVKGGKSAEWYGLGSGILGEFFTSPGEDVEIARQKDASAQKIADIYLNTHKSFAEFLEQGGFNTLKKFGVAMSKNPQKYPQITVDGLLQFEKDADQKKRLEALQKSASITRDTLAEKFTSLGVELTYLHINDNKKFTDYLGHIRKTQFPS